MTTEMKTQNLTYKTPDAADLQIEAVSARNTATMVCVIVDKESLELAKDEMNAMTKRIKELETLRKGITGPLDAAKKGVMDLFRPAVDGYKAAVADIKAAISDYLLEQERKAAEERAKAEAEAAAERKALEDKAKEAETPQQAEALQQAAALVVADLPEKVTEKVSGMSTSKKWKARVTDMHAFLQYVAEHPELADCVEVKTAALERFISATGGTITIPGVEAFQAMVVSSRG